MKTDDGLERQLRSILRDALDREAGPDPAWAESAAARRVAELERRARRRWPLRVLAVAALIGVTGGAALLGGALDERPDASRVPANGWIAFTVGQPAAAGRDADEDIWLVALDQEARRVIGTEIDAVRQLCPAFSPDGRSLAYGRVEGHSGARPPAYRQAALAVADVTADGGVSDRLTIDVGDALPPPCPIWSPDGSQVAFGVPRTSPVNPVTSAAGSEVWIVTLADRHITVLPDLLATDLEWSPDGSLLAIASGADELIGGGVLRDGRIHLYAPSSGAMRSLDATLGATQLTWSPDGGLMAYTTGDLLHELRVLDVETGGQRTLAAFEANHGIGPVWSPDGETIVYQRLCETQPDSPAPCREQHEVVLLTPVDPSDEAATPQEVVFPAFRATTEGSGWYLFPFRVTWSPDGEYLLYQAWGESGGSGLSEVLVVAVPADPDMPAVILAGPENIVPYEGYPDTTLVPIQTWGRRPSD